MSTSAITECSEQMWTTVVRRAFCSELNKGVRIDQNEDDEEDVILTETNRSQSAE